MGKNILIISTSLRQNGNSDLLAGEFARGAESAGHLVEKVSLIGKQISFCRGCLACQKTCQCVMKDDASVIVEKMKKADVLVFATPVYFYEMSGQMKTFLDRTNPLFQAAYQFRDVYLLASAADTDERVLNRVKEGLQGWIECFPQCSLKGFLCGTGVVNVGEIKGTKAFREAYSLGKSV